MVEKDFGSHRRALRLRHSYKLGITLPGGRHGRELHTLAAGMTDWATQKHIQKILAGADEITDRFGSHLLHNGMTVAQNMAALAQMIAELTLRASDSSDQDREKGSGARGKMASEGE